ncbi:MAG: hypothetical protein ACYTFW_06150 [Planctomycetota bacterium]|jgi:hypothetical protein
MEENFFVFNPIRIKINPEEVIKQLGYSHTDDISPKIRNRVDQETAQALRLIEPKGAFTILDKSRPRGFSLFAGAEKIVLALATIGPAIGLRAKKLIETQQSARGLIVDAAGTVAAEWTADFIEHRIHRHFTHFGWNVSRRYSPGYCGWDVTAQKDIFEHFPDTLGIKLTDGCLMVPEKSLSFALLLSKGGDFSAIKVGNCRDCKQERCPYRLQSYKAISQDNTKSS